MTHRPTHRSAWLPVALLATTFAAAEDPGVATRMQENAAALRSYTWKTRTETAIDGETKNVKLEQVRYDIDGKQQKTSIGGSSPSADSGGKSRRGGRRGDRVKKRIASNIKEKKQKKIQGLMQVVQAYLKPYPDQMKEFVATADKIMAETDQGTLARIKGSGLVIPEDRVTIELDSASQLPRSYRIESLYDGDPFSLVIDFRTLADGPTYPARVIIDYPGEKLVLSVENYDYEPAG